MRQPVRIRNETTKGRRKKTSTKDQPRRRTCFSKVTAAIDEKSARQVIERATKFGYFQEEGRLRNRREESQSNMLSRKERGQTKEKIDRDTKREGRKTASRGARERSTDQDENFLNESSSSQDDDETKPGAVEIAGPRRNMEAARREQLPRERSNSDVVDDANAPAMLVEADLAPELTVADQVHIQEEDDKIIKKKQYRRSLWFAMVSYGIVIILNVYCFLLLFIIPPPAPGARLGTTIVVGLAPSVFILFLDTIIMFLPTTRCCSSIRLEDPDDRRLVRDAQIASAASLSLSIGAIPIIVASPPDFQWLGYALVTWGVAGAVVAFVRVRLLLRSKETRQEMSKAFWAVFLVFSFALCGATVWRIRNPTYPNCFVEYPWHIEDGICDGGEYNTTVCGYDGGDCVRNRPYPDCHVEFPFQVGNGNCDGGPYNTQACGYDGGDCVNTKYPDCHVDNQYVIGDGHCDGVLYNTSACGYDGGDCEGNTGNPMYPDCRVEYPSWIGDGICDEDPAYTTKACHYDGGDCHELNAVNATSPGCHVEHPIAIGDGFCDGGLYMTEECAYDGGDCLEFVGKYPDCHVNQPYRIGDGICDGWVYMTVECAYDGGDCVDFMDMYPDCHVEKPSRIGDGICDGGRYMTLECAYDGGDCLAFMEKYPGCIVGSPLLIGDGVCHPAEPYNTRACGYDGGDCDVANAKYPDCHVENPSRIGDGTCDGPLYGTAECGFDGGDCLEAGKPCHGHLECASESCNDVTKVCDSAFVSEQYPDCRVPMPQWIGDGVCDGGYYASEACGFDGGDCLQLGEPCLQDDECASGFCYNSTKVCYLGILQDYPDCVVEYPRKIGDGTCNFGEYLTEACGYDGGDCFFSQ